MSVNRLGEAGTPLMAREAHQMEHHSVQAFQLEYLDQQKVIPEKKGISDGE